MLSKPVHTTWNAGTGKRLSQELISHIHWEINEIQGTRIYRQMWKKVYWSKTWVHSDSKLVTPCPSVCKRCKSAVAYNHTSGAQESRLGTNYWSTLQILPQHIINCIVYCISLSRYTFIIISSWKYITPVIVVCKLLK